MNDELDEEEVELTKEYALALSIIKKLEEDISITEDDVERAERLVRALKRAKELKE